MQDALLLFFRCTELQYNVLIKYEWNLIKHLTNESLFAAPQLTNGVILPKYNTQPTKYTQQETGKRYEKM